MADEADTKKRRGRPAKPEAKEVVEKPKTAEKRGRAPAEKGDDGGSPAKRGRGRPKGGGKRKSKAKSPKKAASGGGGGSGRGRGRPKKVEKVEEKESSEAEQESGGDDE